jgi:tRNA nucleotidyltransferase/poly(A) polymerase
MTEPNDNEPEAPENDEDQDDAADEQGPAILDESAFEGDDDDDDDDDDMPAHFNVVAQPDEPEQGDRPPPVLDGPPEIPLNVIDADALWVVRRLHAKGYEAYLTGGCVRDLLLGRTPKDFDVATAAHPNQVKAAFRNCRLVGRRFRLAHVFFPSGKVIETATFRANPIDELDDLPTDLLVDRDNVFGNVEQDARRRDLTVNGLFYDPLKGKVIDFVEGRKDLDARLIRTIGNPEVRFQEDPVRILRAIKFATRLGFTIEENTYNAMKTHVGGLVRCAPARLQEELLRLLTSGHALEALRLCEATGVRQAILPEIEAMFDQELQGRTVVTYPPRPQRTVEAPQAARSVDMDVPAADEGMVLEPIAAHVVAINTGAYGVEEPTAPTPVSAAAEPAPAPVVEEPAPEPITQVLTVPTPVERRTRFEALIASLDEARKRDVDVTSAVAFAVLLTPAFEALSSSTTGWEQWFEDLSQRWADRIRLTRHDKERIPQLLSAQDDLLPHRRRGQHARGLVHRPSFKESLLLYTLRLHAKGASLDEVALWKVVAQAAGASYRQPRLSERGPRQRAASRAGGGGGGDRGGDRGGRGGRGGRDRGGRGGRRRR